MATKRIKKNVDKGATSLSEFMSTTDKKVIKRYNNPNSTMSWWKYEPDRLWMGVESAISVLETAQTTRRLMNIQFSRLYSNMDAIGFPYNSLMNSQTSKSNASENKISLNIIQSVIDAVASKVAKDQPKVSFVTNGSDDYFLKLRAAKLTKYVAGVFKQANVYENSELVFRDACVTGTGFLYIYEKEGKIQTEWCVADEIRVDEIDGWKQKPRCMYRVTLRPRDMLCIEYPEFEQEINAAQTAIQGRVAVQSTTEMVRVIESWHLRGSKKSKDGIHCVTIENCTLFSEQYDKDYFPIVPFRWYNRPLGFFGRSITEEIKTIQIEINKILKTIQQAQELIAVPIIFCPNEAEVAEDVLLSNDIARLVPYSGGNPPSIISPQALSPEVYSHLNSLIQWAFQIVGLSQTTASGMKPAGVDSAVAIREVSDIETGRFAMVANRWEQFFIDVARVIVDISRDLYMKDPDLAVTYTEKKLLREIKWKDVDLQDNPFDIQTFPTSQLPDSPAGRIQTITEYVQNQWISKERAMELLSLDPDLESEVNIQTASLRLTEKWLSQMVEDGIYNRPEPTMNLPLAQQVAQGVLCQLQVDGAPEDRLQLVRNFIDDCITLQQTPPPNTQPPMSAPPQAPAAPAGAPDNPAPIQMPGNQ